MLVLLNGRKFRTYPMELLLDCSAFPELTLTPRICVRIVNSTPDDTHCKCSLKCSNNRPHHTHTQLEENKRFQVPNTHNGNYIQMWWLIFVAFFCRSYLATPPPTNIQWQWMMMTNSRQDKQPLLSIHSLLFAWMIMAVVSDDIGFVFLFYASISPVI